MPYSDADVSAAQAFLDSGVVTAETAGLLARSVAHAAGRFNFPAVHGHNRWDVDAVNETVQEFCAAGEKTLQQRLTHMALRSVGPENFLAQLQTSLANHIRSELRATQRGRLEHNLRKILDAATDVVEVTQNVYALSDFRGAVPLVGLHEEQLVAAAWAVDDVRTVRWRPDSKHEPPIAHSEDLARVAVAILRAAGGAVDMSTLVKVCAARFDVRDTPSIVGIDEIGERLADPVANETGESLAMQQVAVDVWNQLTEREQAVLPMLDETVRVVGEQLGIAKTTAAKAQASCKRTLERCLTSDEEEASSVLGWLQRFALGAKVDKLPGSGVSHLQTPRGGTDHG